MLELIQALAKIVLFIGIALALAFLYTEILIACGDISKIKKSANKIPKLQKIELGENEVLAITYTERITKEFFTQLSENLKDKMPDNFKGKILILDGNPKLTAINIKPNFPKI